MVIDYAGLFPPASLDFDTSIRNFAAYRAEERSWMLNTFVCPSARLEEIEPYADPLRNNAPHPVSVLGPPSADLTEWQSGLRTLLGDIERFQNLIPGTAYAAALELKMSAAVAMNAGSLKAAVGDLVKLNEALPDADVFLELVPAASPGLVSAVAGALRRLRPEGQSRYGLKLRTGGVVPDSIPKSEQVAGFICACRDAGIRFKATAGLHHPFYHYSETVGADMHGFLNVIVGAMLAHSEMWTAETLADFLQLRTFDVIASHDGIAVGNHALTSATITRLRDEFFVSFGSCNFDEPWEDLVDLGLVH